MAARAAPGHARRGPDRVPPVLSLQQLPGDGRPRARGAYRLGALRGVARPITRPPVKPIPHQRRAGIRSTIRRASPAPSLLRRLGSPPSSSGWGSERIDYIQGLPERLAALRFFFETHPQYLERLVFVPARGARSREYDQPLPGDPARGRGERPGNQPEVPDEDVASRRLSEGAPRAPRHLVLLSPRRLLHGDLAPRRDEPRGRANSSRCATTMTACSF